METERLPGDLRKRHAPVDMSPERFRTLGYQVVDAVADLLEALPGMPVTPGERPKQIRSALGRGAVPERGMEAGELLEETARLLVDHSLFNGHPRFFGYITSSAAPIGALGDLLAAAVNPNVGAYELSPMATEIEAQTVRWIAELIGYPTDCGGLLGSGGNVANFVGFLAARRAKAPWAIREEGLSAGPQLALYVSKETHTWIQKAADLFGLGTEAIRWVETDSRLRIDMEALEAQIKADREAGMFPFLVVGTAGTVSTGAVDPLPAIAALCRRENLWFHVDGAYGATAAMLPEASADLKGLADADSVALDPHKWFYSPLEAGCTLVRDSQHLVDAFSYHPEYYAFGEDREDPQIDYLEHGLQNSRGFRALKVWLGLRNVGREGFVRMLREDIALSKALYDSAQAHPELEAFTQDLSITTFRYVPEDLRDRTGEMGAYLNELNQALLEEIKSGGEVFLSNAVVDGSFLLRASIVNFRTALPDVEAVVEVVVRVGRRLDARMRGGSL